MPRGGGAAGERRRHSGPVAAVALPVSGSGVQELIPCSVLNFSPSKLFFFFFFLISGYAFPLPKAWLPYLLKHPDLEGEVHFAAPVYSAEHRRVLVFAEFGALSGNQFCIGLARARDSYFLFRGSCLKISLLAVSQVRVSSPAASKSSGSKSEASPLVR